jgi:hypothetical protein
MEILKEHDDLTDINHIKIYDNRYKELEFQYFCLNMSCEHLSEISKMLSVQVNPEYNPSLVLTVDGKEYNFSLMYHEHSGSYYLYHHSYNNELIDHNKVRVAYTTLLNHAQSIFDYYNDEDIIPGPSRNVQEQV